MPRDHSDIFTAGVQVDAPNLQFRARILLCLHSMFSPRMSDNDRLCRPCREIGTFQLARYTTVPKTFPIPAVNAIASAPQNVTRTVARSTLAPPALAPIAPRRARKPKEAIETIGTSNFTGETTTMSSGIA